MTDDELINEIEVQRGLMISVATRGPRIQEVNNQYTQRRIRIAVELQRRILTEKTHALLERSRPRDLYDIVHLLENARE